MEHLGAHADALAEVRGADGADHELLECDRGVRVRAAVDDIHHRHGKRVGVHAADVAVKRQTEALGGGLGDGEGDAEDRVGTELALGGGAVKRQHLVVDSTLVAGAHADDVRGDDLVDVFDRLEDALAEVAALVAVAQFESLVDAGGGPGGNGGASDGAVSEGDVDFYRGVAAGVENFPGVDVGDFHVVLFCLWLFGATERPRSKRGGRIPPRRV